MENAPLGVRNDTFSETPGHTCQYPVMRSKSRGALCNLRMCCHAGQREDGLNWTNFRISRPKGVKSRRLRMIGASGLVGLDQKN